MRSKKVAERKIHEHHGLTFVTVTVDFPSLGFRQARLVSDSFELLPFFTPWKLKSLNWKIGNPISYFFEIDFLHPGNFDENWNSRNCQLQKILRIFWCPGVILLGISLINFTKSPTVHPVCCDGCTGALQEDVKNKYSRCLYLYVYKKLDVQNLYIFSKAICIKEKVLLNFIKPY